MSPGGPPMMRGGQQNGRGGQPGVGPGPGPGAGGGPRGFGGGRPSGTPRWPHHDWNAMEKSDPDMFKLFSKDHALERRTRELSVQYRQAPKEQRPSIRKELTEAVDAHFEVRQERRSLELKRLEEELNRLRSAIERRSKAKKDISSRRIAELLGEDDMNF